MDVTKLVWNMPICQCGKQHNHDVRMTHNDDDDVTDADIEEAMVRNAEDYEGFVDGPLPSAVPAYVRNAVPPPAEVRPAAYAPVPVFHATDYDDVVTNADDGFADAYPIPAVNWRAVMAGR